MLKTHEIRAEFHWPEWTGIVVDHANYYNAAINDVCFELVRRGEHPNYDGWVLFCTHPDDHYDRCPIGSAGKHGEPDWEAVASNVCEALGQRR